MSTARATLLALLALAGVASSVRGEGDPEPPIAERAWFKKAPWTQDYAKAREVARRDDKLVFAYFTQHH